MPATSLKQLFAIESALGLATQSILHAAGLHDNYLERHTGTLPQSWIEITPILGAATNQGVRIVADAEVLDYDFFDCLLDLRLVTTRNQDQPVLLPGIKDHHEDWSAAVRVALREAANPYTEALLPYHAVKRIMPMATDRGLESATWLLDYTRLQFSLAVGIRSQAWPASA